MYKDKSNIEQIKVLIHSRKALQPKGEWFRKSPEAEGGCGVTGFACTIPVRGKHIYEPSIQMRNRGNGKGGGIAACGLVPEDFDVSRKVLEEDYIIQVALLDPKARQDVEKTFIEPYFNIDQGGMCSTVDDYREIPLLEVKPPDIARYFVRVKPDILARFAEENNFKNVSKQDIEDEFIFQNSYKLNTKFYSSLGEKKAFVLSHARNLIIIKIVGYAEAAVQYYKLADTKAHVWIAHQRYPTKGRVWHPGGAHPFIGMNEALVHNGDFANYHSVCEYLAQANLFPQFLTDTEVSVMLFDLMSRVYKYPVEYIIEAIAPTTELDFDRLPEEKQRIYREIQAIHTHASPDGPWFFIIARNLPNKKAFQLLGITDTAMLRPQVFACQEGEVSIGLICSEKQAIDATLASLANEDSRFTPVADMYWNARGGSHTDGGAFIFTISPKMNNNNYDIQITNKFGDKVSGNSNQVHYDFKQKIIASPKSEQDNDIAFIDKTIKNNHIEQLFRFIRGKMVEEDFHRLYWLVREVAKRTWEKATQFGIDVLTLCLDRRYPTGKKQRSSVITMIREGLEYIFNNQALISEQTNSTHVRITWDTRKQLRAPQANEKTLLIDARGFSAEGNDCDALIAVQAFKLGWMHLVHYNTRGTRFHAAGFGPNTNGLRIDIYDNPGDYLGSGMDGLNAYIHCNAQDQVCQISKSGKLVIYGDVGQTFLYGAKGGEVYVLGNAAGRPMINAVGKPKVVINGTALDFLAESFMAGDPLNGGGFAIVNGIQFNNKGQVIPLDLPYPGSNLLSLASGGAIYIRDPNDTLVLEQLNAGEYKTLTDDDWRLILPYLQENERLFGIEIKRDLLTVDGIPKTAKQVYKKVTPVKH